MNKAHIMLGGALILVLLLIGLFVPPPSAPVEEEGEATPSSFKEFSTPEYSVRYPEEYGVRIAHIHEGIGGLATTTGIAFTLPTQSTFGTNLSSDSYISIETSEDTYLLPQLLA